MVVTAWFGGLLGVALAADEPCYGHSLGNRHDSDHFWVEWAEGVLDTRQAGVIADAAEASRETYLGLGWPMTDEAVVIAVLSGDSGGISGIAETSLCDGEPVPRVTLTIGEYTDERAWAVVSHELGHVAEYGYMGAYLDSVESWLWWMEGTASWLETEVTEDRAEWGRTSAGYLVSPSLALHHGVNGFLSEQRSDHMYGTAVLARYLEEVGGQDTVRQTWEWGASQSGETIWFPDAVDAVGLDFDEVWTRWMATVTVGDMGWGDDLTVRAKAQDVDRLPSNGTPDDPPEGMGLGVIHFDAATGARNKALQVSLSADDDVPWRAVLVRTDGARIGGSVRDYVVLPVDGAGEASGWLTGFDGNVDGWLVVSPSVPDVEPFTFSWQADLVDDPGPMEGTIIYVPAGDPDETPTACGCTTTPTHNLLWTPLLLLVWGSGRERSPRSARRQADPNRGRNVNVHAPRPVRSPR